MSGKKNTRTLDKYLKENDIELLQKGVFIGKDARLEINKFCKGLFIPNIRYSSLLSRGYKPNEIIRTTILLSIIATKAKLINKQKSNDHLITICISDSDKKERCIDVDGVNVFQISRRDTRVGWNVHFIRSSIIGNDSELEAILCATVI